MSGLSVSLSVALGLTLFVLVRSMPNRVPARREGLPRDRANSDIRWL